MTRRKLFLAVRLRDSRPDLSSRLTPSSSILAKSNESLEANEDRYSQMTEEKLSIGDVQFNVTFSPT